MDKKFHTDTGLSNFHSIFPFESYLYNFISEIVEGKRHEGYLCVSQKASRVSVPRWDFWSWEFLNFDHICDATVWHPWRKQEGGTSLAPGLYCKSCPQTLASQVVCLEQSHLQAQPGAQPVSSFPSVWEAEPEHRTARTASPQARTSCPRGIWKAVVVWCI